jgi:hypothetical protein
MVKLKSFCGILLERLRKRDEKFRIAGVPAEIGTEYLPTYLQPYR